MRSGTVRAAGVDDVGLSCPAYLGLTLPRLIAALPIFVDLVACPQMPFGRWALVVEAAVLRVL